MPILSSLRNKSRQTCLAGHAPGESSASHGFSSQLAVFGAALALLGTLQGCATLSEADCLSADWAVMGEADGEQGRPISELNRYRRQCAEYGLVPDSEAYLDGRERGLARYCTETNGYQVGRAGAGYQPVCPAALAPGFQRAHQLGRAVYTTLSDLHHRNDSIDYAQNTIDDLKSDIADAEASIRSDDTDDEEAERLRDEIDSKERRIDQLEDEVDMLIGSAAISIGEYRAAVEAARREGYDEPMEGELLQQLWRLIR